MLLSVIVAGLLLGDGAMAEVIRSGKGWAIHAQRESADWAKLVVGGNLVAKKLVRTEAAPNGDELAIVPAVGEVKPIPPSPVITTEYRDYVFDRRDQFRKMTAPGNLLLGRELRYSPQPTQYLNIDDDDPRQLTDGKFSERIDEAIWFDRVIGEKATSPNTKRS